MLRSPTDSLRAEPPKTRRYGPGWRFIAAGLAVLLLGIGGWFWWGSTSQDSALNYRTVVIEKGPIQAVVSATGVVNPVRQVSVGTQVSGQLKKLYVDFNDPVQAGQLIALIDPATFEQKLRGAQADWEFAKSNVHTAQARLDSSRVDLEQALHDQARKQSLYEQKFIAWADVDKAQAMVRTMQEAIKVNRSLVEQAQAQAMQKQAVFGQARIDLSHTRITSPLTGLVIKRSVDTGQTVAASLQSPELFLIAKDLLDMQAEINVDESDVGRFKRGMKATFTVDAFPGSVFEGRISQIRRAPQTQANVVSYVVLIVFRNEPERLFPGMTANARIVTDERASVLKVPNAALRVRLSKESPGQAYGHGPAQSGSQTGGSHRNGAVGSDSSGSAGRKHPIDSRVGRLYILDKTQNSKMSQTPQMIPVRLGISDGNYTEIVQTLKPEHAGLLKEGVSVVIGLLSSPGAGAAPSAGGATGPRLPF
jgi:HlyD family secretion protein